MPVNHAIAKLFCRAVSNSSDFYLKPHFTQPILNLRTKVKWTFLLELISFTVLTLVFLMLLLFPTLTDRNSASSGGKEKSVWLCNCKSAELNPGGQLGVSSVQRFLKCKLYKIQLYEVHVASMYAPMYWGTWGAVSYVFVCSVFF